MDLIRRPAALSGRVGLFPGTFNPVTNAHLAMAHAALRSVDTVTFVIPRMLPHKTLLKATLGERVEMLDRVAADEPRFGVAISDGGLVFEMVREARDHQQFATAQLASLHVICGRDAAERYIDWDYGSGHSIDKILTEFHLLVAARDGQFQPPQRLAARVDLLAVDQVEAAQMESCSSTHLRQAIERGDQRWMELAPSKIVDLILATYAPEP